MMVQFRNIENYIKISFKNFNLELKPGMDL